MSNYTLYNASDETLRAVYTLQRHLVAHLIELAEQEQQNPVRKVREPIAEAWQSIGRVDGIIAAATYIKDLDFTRS